MHSRSRGLHKRPSAQVGPCTGERAEADQSACEQNALPFALPSLNTANSDRCLFASGSAGLSEVSARARQIRLRDQSWPDAIAVIGAEPADHDHQMAHGSEGGWIMVSGAFGDAVEEGPLIAPLFPFPLGLSSGSHGRVRG